MLNRHDGTANELQNVALSRVRRQRPVLVRPLYRRKAVQALLTGQNHLHRWSIRPINESRHTTFRRTIGPQSECTEAAQIVTKLSRAA